MFELIGAIAGVGALIYMAFFGQKTLREVAEEIRNQPSMIFICFIAISKKS